ncbi:MAG: hypothetical protein DYG98_05190 [Haliscomenobacteraceae bacterium CHB4]|nr:hypothetical protein [Saprospiraceae bacterium]MCE7922429.1 hypothetical protein [Haliscomenobacteraceae bacterium CHB4]
MKNALSPLVPVYLLLLLTSCKHYYYLPNNMVMPAVQKQHDAIVSVAACDFRGTEFQAAYSPLKYTALTYNYMKIPRSSQDDEKWGRGRLSEAGTGAYFGKFPWTVYLLGGYGGGFVENAYGYADGTFNHIKSRLDFEQWFVQPGFVLQTRVVRLGLAVRRKWLHYYKGTIDVDKTPQGELNAISNIERESPLGFTELGVTVGIRLRPFTFSYNSARILGNDTFYHNLQFAKRNYNFMLTLDLYELWRWKDTPPRKRKTGIPSAHH